LTFSELNQKIITMKYIKSILVVSFLFVALSITNAQAPPHPNGGGSPGGGNTPVGGGAPIDGGVTLLMLLGAAYGTKKVLKNKNG